MWIYEHARTRGRARAPRSVLSAPTASSTSRRVGGGRRLPDGPRFVSGSSDRTARVAYHGLALPPTPDYVAARKAELDEVIRRANDERTALERRLAMQ